MHGVPGTVGDYVPQDLFTQQCQIADQVQNFVAHKFIGKAQWWIHQAVAGKHNRVFLGRAANQALLPHGIGFVQKTERPGSCDLRAIVSVRQVHLESFFPIRG